MPTPVSLARQCLTDEAARAIDDAVSVARRRSHGQTTSLHAVSALLTSASSALLREACARARSSAYSPRLQFRALELSVGVSLDRLPTCSTKTLAEPPPISNSLMAAIKRSQANQRRQPESFYLLQQQQLQQQTTSLFKVELKHLVLSILDDPIVSRVFGEAGFRSCDVKFAIIHSPVTSPSSSSRLLSTRYPPIFLCNLTDSDPVRKGFSFPFMGGEDENCGRIGKVIARKTGRNPLLFGVSATDTLNYFVDCVPRGKKGGIEIDGLCVISIGNDVSEFVNNGGDKEKLDLKFREIEDSVKSCQGPGIVVNFGELTPLVEEDGVSVDCLSYLVSLFMNLLELYRDKLWLIGAAGSYEMYMKLIARFPTIEKDLDLHLLPITSSKPSIPEFGSKSSLMGSFVPFGGFFSSSSDFNILLTGNNGFKTRCEMCNKKYDEEVSSLKRGCNLSVADQYSSTLPSWLQITEIDPSKGVSTTKAKEDESIISAKIMGLQKKWDGICQTIHHTPLLPKPDIGQTRTDVLSTEVFRFSPDKNQKNSKDSPPSETRSATLSPFIDKDLHSPYKQSVQRPVASKASITSVTTDLGLGTLYASTHQEPKNTQNEEHEKGLQNLASSINAKIDSNGKSNPSDFKSIWRELLEKVGRQEEAICTISETVSRFKNGEGKRGSSRGDIWLSFLGPDKVGKKLIASALAEVVFGSPESLISFDLNFQDGIIQSNSIFYSQGYDEVKYRGKTVVDCIAEELRRRPRSIIFLENMDKADPLAQSSLSQAIRTGKFPDSHGREISINNTIFVTTSNTAKGNHNLIPQKVDIRLSEEVILEAKRWQMQILIRNIDGSPLIGAEKEIPSFISMNKRKLSDTINSTYQDVASEMQKHPQKLSRSCLDLNLPLSEMEDDISENSEEWSDKFFEQVDEKIVLKPFNFDALADKVLKEIKKKFLKTFESGVRLEIENPAMVQIVAAAWVSNEKRAVEDWVDDVLRRSFDDARMRYCPNAQSVVKLMACEGILMKEQAPGIRLPASIIIN